MEQKITSAPKLEALERKRSEIGRQRERDGSSSVAPAAIKRPRRTTAKTNEPDDGHEIHSSKAVWTLTVTVIMFKLWSVKNESTKKCSQMYLRVDTSCRCNN